MNKYLSLVLICSAVTIYAQNPSDKKLAVANKMYETLAPDEKNYCDLIYRDIATHHARELYAHEKEQLIPREINLQEDLAALGLKKAELYQKLNLSPAQLYKINRISLTRMTALWKYTATLIGKNTPWPFTYEDQGEDLSYVVASSENESSS